MWGVELHVRQSPRGWLQENSTEDMTAESRIWVKDCPQFQKSTQDSDGLAGERAKISSMDPLPIDVWG